MFRSVKVGDRGNRTLRRPVIDEAAFDGMSAVLATDRARRWRVAGSTSGRRSSKSSAGRERAAGDVSRPILYVLRYRDFEQAHCASQ
jgi:hypothetical protein